MTKLVGILNITPDSFSDGGKFFDVDRALKHAIKMSNDGAYAIDIGAESTRPNADILSENQEWERLEPVLTQIISLNLPAKISVDTRNIETAEKSLKLAVDWINLVSGSPTSKLIKLIGEFDATLILMHNMGLPANPNKTISADLNPLDEVYQWGENIIDKICSAGLSKSKIIFDPGIGFGKTAEQSMTLINRVEIFKKLGVPIMIGHSRKSFLKLMTDSPAHRRDAATYEISQQLTAKDIDYLRVHDVKGNL